MADILEYTYYNAEKISAALESIGYRGIQALDVSGLQAAGNPGDRETHHIEGNRIIYPKPPVNYYYPSFNGVACEISFNSEGEDSDDWIYLEGTWTADRPSLQEFGDFPFYKFTIRNPRNVIWVYPTNFVRLYIIQDPTFMVQLNKLVKDIIT